MKCLQRRINERLEYVPRLSPHCLRDSINGSSSDSSTRSNTLLYLCPTFNVAFRLFDVLLYPLLNVLLTTATSLPYAQKSTRVYDTIAPDTTERGLTDDPLCGGLPMSS